MYYYLDTPNKKIKNVKDKKRKMNLQMLENNK